MGMTAAVAGASGAVGGELVRLIDRHPVFELGPLTAASQAGRRVAEVHPGLADRADVADRVLEPTEASRLAGADVVFLAVPRGDSGRIAAELPPAVRVVDLGPDHRLADPAVWERVYGGPHAGHWPFGLPEIPGARRGIADADRVAVPSCYATGVLLALAPLVLAGLAEPSDIVVTIFAGTSTAGRSAAPASSRDLSGAVASALRGYQTNGEHGSIPEMEQELTALCGARATVCMTPLLAPIPRGILATCAIRTTGAPTLSDLRDALTTTYRDEPFVRLLAAGRWPTTATVAGSNLALLQVSADARSGRATVLVALDNLGKGAAGQAVQDANLMLGLPESAGLVP